MNEFIQMVVSKLGVDESAARSATGGVLNMIQGQTDGADFNQLVDKLPGAEDVMRDAPQATEQAGSGGGMLGGLMGKAAGMVSGAGGSGLALGSMFEKSGIGVDKLGSFATMFVGFVKDKAGADVVGRILDQVPALKKFTG